MALRRYAPLPSRTRLALHLAYSLVLGIIAIAVALGAGMTGYHVFEHMPWIDAFLNASMILSGMGPVGTLSTTGGKLFAGCYALFSGLTFILIIGFIFAPVIRYFFHKMHIEIENKP